MIIPNQVPNQIVEEIVNNSKPRYIGFLEYLNIPETTKEDACFGAKGLTVVFCFLKDLTAEMKTNSPKIKRNRLILLLL